MMRSSRKSLRPRRFRDHPPQLVPFLMGMAMGFVLMYLAMVPSLASRSSSSMVTSSSSNNIDNLRHQPNNSLRRQREHQEEEVSLPESSSVSRRPPVNDEEEEGGEKGWSTLNIFYGDREGLFGYDNKPEHQTKREYYGQVRQDAVILDLLGPSGYFVDLAANDAMEYSNTLGLEQRAAATGGGWTGLCIEPNPVYWYGLSHRKCTVVGALLGGSVERVDVKFRGVFGGIVGKMDEKLADRKREPDSATERRYTAPIREVFKKFRVPAVIDYMNLDVEGAEYLIMQHFPFDEYTIKVLTVERPKKPLKQLFEKHGYKQIKKLAWWGETLWAHESTGFTPQHPKIIKIKTEEP